MVAATRANASSVTSHIEVVMGTTSKTPVLVAITAMTGQSGK